MRRSAPNAHPARDKLGSIGLYELDVAELAARHRPSVAFASITLALYNFGRLAALPPTVINDCGLDYDRWYPKHRRVIGAVSSVRHFRADLPHFRAALDRVGETCGVRCAPVRV